jgi:hydroxymethylbilane synthase
MRTRIRVGTRASKLALAQTNQAIEELRKTVPGLRCDIIPIQTKGDKKHEVGTSIEGKDIFTKEIEEALIEGRVDIAIHSMKDLTVDMPAGVTIAAVPKRANPHDVLISREKRKFMQLSAGSRIGTGSARRRSQLLAARGDLQMVDIHGNVETRLRKLTTENYDAIIMAAAGLERLHLEHEITEVLPTNLMLPAVGQGALAIQSRSSDEEVIDLIAKIDHPFTRREIEAERAFAKKLGGNCRTPVAAYARSYTSKLMIEGMIASSNGRMLVRGRIASDNPNPNQVGEELARSLLDKGAEALLEKM